MRTPFVQVNSKLCGTALLPLYLAPLAGFEPTTNSLEDSGHSLFFEFYFHFSFR